MKRILYLFFMLISCLAFAEKQDSIGVETKGTKKYVRYLVGPSETIYHLSTTHKVSVTDLMTDNPGLENGLKVGQILLLRNYIRTNTAKASVFEPKTDTHVVLKGETYFRISQKYGIPVNNLIAWNGFDLKEGQIIVLKAPKSIEKTTEVKTPTTSPIKTNVPDKKIEATEVKNTNVKTNSNTEVTQKAVPESKTSSTIKTTMEPEESIQPAKINSKPIETTTSKPAATQTAHTTKPTTSNSLNTVTNSGSTLVVKEKEKLSENESIYEFDPNKQQVLIIPFDPHLYWSDADEEIKKGSGLNSTLEVRKTIRRRLNALLDPMGFENIHLMGGKFQDTLTDLNKIYTSVSYDYQSAILSEAYKKTLAQQQASTIEKGEVATDNSMKSKLAALKNKVSNQTEVEETKIDNNADKYFGVLVKDFKFFDYFNNKYSVDYYIFVNQFEVITDYDHCLDRTTENYVRTFVVHFSIFDSKGIQIAGNKHKQQYNSNSNNIDRITGDNLQAMADRILLELPLPNK